MSTTEPTANSPLPVSVDDVLEARKLLEGVVRHTPLESSRPLSEKIGGPAYLKCENLQRAGSFKIRGAYTRMSRLSPEQKAGGVVAASAGNHAQGVALAAQMLGIRTKVYMPMGAPIPKVMATRGYGAEVELLGQTIEDCLSAAKRYAAEQGAVLIHPFDHVDIVAGQGTVGLEILEQCPDVKTVVVGTGGGGLLSGIATVMRAKRPDVRIIGVQAEKAAAYPPSLAAGRPVALERMSTMADGIAVGCPGEVTFEIVSALVHEFVTVSEETLSRAMLLLLERAKLVVEPAGAASVAAIMDNPTLVEPPAVAVLSGGNIDPLLMLRVLRHGMAAAGRYLQFWVRVPDRPGSLSALLAMLAEADANVLEVEHVRTNATLGLDEVEIAVQVETKGHEHCDQVIAALRERGYPLQVG
ncbi:MAG: threonine ammonia-lyase [Actinomycetales bacterium]